MYPVHFEADYVERPDRLSTAFRFILIIPHAIVAVLYGIAGFFTVIAAWFALVFTARYPQGLYEFNTGVVRFLTRFQAYVYLLTDRYPSFGTEHDPNYPVRLLADPPQERYSRLKVGFRLILALPIMVLRNYVIGPLLFIVSVAAWFVIVFTGRQLPGIHNALKWGMAYTARSDGYLALLTDRYPPFTEPGDLEAGAAPAGALPAAGPAAPIDAPERPAGAVRAPLDPPPGPPGRGFDPPEAPPAPPGPPPAAG
jgi:uncharacterized membrane protein